MNARLRGLAVAALRWAVASEQSTRSSGLLRILIALLVLARWAADLRLYLDLTWSGFALRSLFFVATTCMLFGIASRLSSFITGALCMALVYVFGVSLPGYEPWTHHHTRLLAHAAMLAALLPSHRSYSVDRFLHVRRARRAGRAPDPERGNVWGVRLMALQLSVVYFFTALDKLTPGFLSGARLQHFMLHYYTGSDFPDGTLVEPALMGLSWTVVLLELALAFGMLCTRARPWLVVPGLLMHGAFYTLLPVSTFSMTVWVLYLACFEPDQVHRAIELLHGHDPAQPPPGVPDPVLP